MGGDTWRPKSTEEPEGLFDPEGNLYLPPDSADAPSPGGGTESGTTTGTTGQVLPPGSGKPLDQDMD